MRSEPQQREVVVASCRGDRSTAMLAAVFVSLALLPVAQFGYRLSVTGPSFAEPITNLTVPIYRDAIFTCSVKNLGVYRVGWVKADTKAIQAIHDSVITENPRVSVSHAADLSTWRLHIKRVIPNDSGQYMCQINTNPMMDQFGYLDVVVPPEIIDEQSSSDLMVAESSPVKLTCRARGHPPPRITWRREDSQHIVFRQHDQRIKVASFDGETLRLPRISRSDMGVYLCIANNGVPPTKSKRITVNVQFHPTVRPRNQLVGAPFGTDVKLECYVEAFPKSVNYWIRNSEDMVVSSDRYLVEQMSTSSFETVMALTVRELRPQDVGSYGCVTKNSIGEASANIRIYEIPGPAGKALLSRYNDEDILSQRDNQLDTDNSKGGNTLSQNSNEHQQHRFAAASVDIAHTTVVRVQNTSTANIDRHGFLIYLIVFVGFHLF